MPVFLIPPIIFILGLLFIGLLFCIVAIVLVTYVLVNFLLDKILDYLQSKNETPEQRKLRLMIKAWRKGKHQVRQKSKKELEEQENQIRKLAIDYIRETSSNDNIVDKLTFENYKEFNNIVQIKNGIIVETNYPSEIVPYLIRNILYTEFNKRLLE